MKLVCLAYGGCFLIGAALAAECASIKTETNTIPEKELTIERTFRGDECVMFQMTRSNRTTTAFLINGNVVAAESDEDGDGFKESFTIFDPDTKEFDQFLRHTNGVVVPISSAELEQLKSKAASADKGLSDLVRTNRTQ